ncbi:MAG TPA: M14 metallopeptidase family protein [Terriglobales bacterium]
MRNSSLLTIALLLVGLASGGRAQSAVPTPASVLGHTPGDDFYLANYEESNAYFHKLAASSNRIRMVPVGATTRGIKNWEIAIISAPENLEALDKYKDINKRLTLARGLDDKTAGALAREGKVIVHIDGGMHSSEVAGAQHSINLAYHLVSAQNDPEVDAILHNVILVLWPTLNPDGQDEVVSWYRKNLGTSFEVSPLPDLYQEYVGHDNNRDGYMNNMLESQVITRQELDWNPEVFYTQHQTAPFPARIFIPPFVEPISSNINPTLMRWLNAFGINMGAYLDEHGMPGAIHRVGFDNWYPGFQDFTGIFRNSIAFFTETALYGYATPHFYTVRDFPRDFQNLDRQVMYNSPWKGGWWRLGDAVRYMVGASMSVLDTAAKYHEELLYNKYQAARDTMAQFTENPPYAYVIPAEQAHPAEAADLARVLLTNGVEVHRAEQAFAANGRSYPAGSWVILMDQPFAQLAKELIEPQVYPDLRSNGVPIRPYDVAGWTLPLQMDVEADAVAQPVTAAQRAGLRLLTSVTTAPGKIEGAGSVYELGPETNQHFAVMNAALAAGGTVRMAPDGTIAVSGVSAERMGELLKTAPAGAKAAASAPADAETVKKPRVGLYRSWSPNSDEGWTRWILQNYGFAPITLHNGDIQASDLIQRFDVIILPDAGANQILNGFGPGTLPGEYVGGIGELGVQSLRAFVAAGGTLVAFNNASQFAIDQFGLPVVNVLAKLKPDEFYCSGSLLTIDLNGPQRRDTAGLPEQPHVMFENGPAFATEAGFRGAILATYPDHVSALASGYLLGANYLEGKAAALEVAYGKGRVYLFGFKPQWRAQSHGTYKFMFNAIYDSPASSRPSSFPAPAGLTSIPVPGAPAAAPAADQQGGRGGRGGRGGN